MADIESIDIVDNKISIKMSLSMSEYEIIGKTTKNMAVLPINEKSLNQKLTTGKLGNSNRVMIPKKFLEKSNIKDLLKNVDAGLFKINGIEVLVIKLSNKDKIEIPSFED